MTLLTGWHVLTRADSLPHAAHLRYAQCIQPTALSSSTGTEARIGQRQSRCGFRLGYRVCACCFLLPATTLPCPLPRAAAIPCYPGGDRKSFKRSQSSTHNTWSNGHADSCSEWSFRVAITHCLETVRPGTSSTEPRIGDGL